MRLLQTAAMAAIAGMAALAGMAPAQAASSPQDRVLELRDDCEAASFNAEFPGLCTNENGSVSLDEFREALADGGHGAWWMRQRDITIKAGDTISAENAGGIVHTFTEVDQFGKGCVAEWNQAVSETVDNCDFGKFLNTLVPQGGTSAAHELSVGVHKFECLIHPWMRSVVTVKKR